jgi:hypothetical protein
MIAWRNNAGWRFVVFVGEALTGVGQMPEHADHRFSATLSTRDLALVGCLRALAEFSQQASNDSASPEAAGEKDWRAAGQKVSFWFSRALDRDLFKNEVRRLLPANLVRFDGESDHDSANRAALSSRSEQSAAGGV